MDSFELFGLDEPPDRYGQELAILVSVEGFFELRSSATEGKKAKIEDKRAIF